MNNQRVYILDILQQALGAYKTAKDEYVFKCPHCNHRKKKLQINIDTQLYHCWVCHTKGVGLVRLLYGMGADINLIQSMKKYAPFVRASSYSKPVEDRPVVTLPSNLRYFSRGYSNELEYARARDFLFSRGLSFDELIKYRIGYCITGDYRYMVIIPSFDSDGKLSFFVARSYDDRRYVKYKMPPISKDIIFFDLFINWREPITLVEGVFDALAVKRNAIPLLGTSIQPMLMEKILWYKPMVNVALDFDAAKNATNILQTLMTSGIDAKLIKLQTKDPSDMGFRGVTDLIANTGNADYRTLIESKLNSI